MPILTLGIYTLLVSVSYVIVTLFSVSHSSAYRYKWLFVILSIASGAAIISGISLFYISKEGWSKANNYIINVFVTSSTVALLFGSLPVIYKMQDNIKFHATSLIYYNNLYNQILTKLAKLSQPSNSKPSQLNLIVQQLQKIIDDTDEQIKINNQIFIYFDSDSISLPNFLINTKDR